MSAWRTPNGAKASITAFTTAGGEPTVPDSPTPLPPRGCGVDVDDAEITAVGVGQVGRVVHRRGVEVTLHTLGELQIRMGQQGDLLDRPTVGGAALHLPAAGLPLQVVGRALQRRRGDDPGL